MRAISRSKHTKLKNTKIYSKGVLVNHTKISTNENFPLYGILSASCLFLQIDTWRIKGARFLNKFMLINIYSLI